MTDKDFEFLGVKHAETKEKEQNKEQAEKDKDAKQVQFYQKLITYYNKALLKYYCRW
jgi:hypothetical protein